jgi:replicative DNA helicase
MGKSLMGAALARNVAKQGLGVGSINLEMDSDEIGLREAAALAYRQGGTHNPFYLSAMRGKLSADQWARMREAAKAAAALPIYFDARAGRTLSQIEAAAGRLFRKLRREGIEPGALIVDHEGLIAAEQRHPSELEAARARGNGLLALAKRLDVWTIALSQITKEGARADGKEHLPTSHDLNFGSALSQAANVVILLHRKGYYAERKPGTSRTHEDVLAIQSNEASLIVDKARGGARGTVNVTIDLPTAAVFEHSPARAA